MVLTADACCCCPPCWPPKAEEEHSGTWQWPRPCSAHGHDRCATLLHIVPPVLLFDGLFRCLSTEQLRPHAPMLKLWRRRMSIFLAYVTAVVILSLTIGTSACDPFGFARLVPASCLPPAPRCLPPPATLYYIRPCGHPCGNPLWQCDSTASLLLHRYYHP